MQLGTPNRGSFAAPLALRGEYPPIRFLAALDIRKDIDDVLDIVWTFRGLLELLPDPRLDSGDESASFLYDPQLWGKRLESAEALRAELDAAGDRHEALSLDGSGIDLIVGDGMPTPTAARRSPTPGLRDRGRPRPATEPSPTCAPTSRTCGRGSRRGSPTETW